MGRDMVKGMIDIIIELMVVLLRTSGPFLRFQPPFLVAASALLTNVI